MEREWPGATGLAEDVRYYGAWMREEAQKRIGHLYPKVEVTAEMAKARTDLKPYVGRKLTVVAWLWARTVKSPNPAFAVFIEALHLVRSETVFRTKSIHMTAVNVIDPLIQRSHPQSPISIPQHGEYAQS